MKKRLITVVALSATIDPGARYPPYSQHTLERKIESSTPKELGFAYLAPQGQRHGAAHGPRPAFPLPDPLAGAEEFPAAEQPI